MAQVCYRWMVMKKAGVSFGYTAEGLMLLGYRMQKFVPPKKLIENSFEKEYVFSGPP